MNKILDFLEGKKTYIGALVMAVAGILYGLKKIDETTFKTLQDFGTAICAVGIYHLIKRQG